MSERLNRKQRRRAAQQAAKNASAVTPEVATPEKAVVDKFLQSVDIDPVVIRISSPPPVTGPTTAIATDAPSKPTGPAPVTLSWGAAPQVTWRPGLTLGAVLPALTVTPPEAEVDVAPPRATALKAGDVTVTATIRDATRYSAAPATLTFSVGRAQPTILWDAPQSQPHMAGGFKLTGAQLNAVASPGAGPATYEPAEGAALGVGKHKLKVTFAESLTHAKATGEVEFEVVKARSAITWTAPAAVDFVKDGFKLTATELSAVSVPPGLVLKFTPALGSTVTAGKHALKAEVADATLDGADAETVVLEVRKAKPVITWAPPPVQVLGTNGKFKLTANSPPLNATCTEGESTLVYEPGADTELSPGTKGGPTHANPHPPLLPKSYVITVTHAESENYEFAQRTVLLTIAPSANAKEGFDTVNAGGAAAFSPTAPLDATVKDAWDKDKGKVKTQAVEIMAALPNMTTDEMIAYMDKLADVASKPGNYQTDEYDNNVTPPKRKMYYNKAWILPNGLQIRLKPNGDPFTNPHLQNPGTAGTRPTIPMFAVEVRKPSKFDFTATGGNASGDFSEGASDTATKVTADGKLGPWGPGQTTEGGKANAALTEYTNATTQATHHQCRSTKKTQVIVCPSAVTLPHGTKLDPAVLGVRLQPGDGALSLDVAADVVLPIGTKTVTVTAAESKGFATATKTVSVKIEKGKPSLVWKTPAAVDHAPGGFALTATQLNAALTPAIAGQPVYTPALGATLGAGSQMLRADVAATAERDAASATVTLEVRKSTPTITPKTSSRQEATAGAGVALAVADVVSATVPPDLAVVLDPPAGTVLPPGSYRVQARFAGDANTRAAAVETDFTVTAVPA